MIRNEPIVIYLRVIQLMIHKERGVVVHPSPPQNQKEIEYFEKIINSPKFLEFYFSVITN